MSLKQTTPIYAQELYSLSAGEMQSIRTSIRLTSAATITVSGITAIGQLA